MTRDSGFKLKTVNLDLGVRKNFFCVCGEALEPAAQGTVESPSLEVFKDS